MTARLPIPSAAISADGSLYIADGATPVKRWDGYASSIGYAGVPAPSTSVTVGSSSTGTIVGDIYAYQRWLDADGRVSNVSPVSAVHTPAASTKAITAATNATPIVVTSAAHGLSNGTTVKVTGVQGNYSANGTWVIANVTTDTFELAGSEGVGDYTEGGTAEVGAGQIDYTSVDAPSDSRVVTRQILRNKDGNTAVFYIDVTSTNLVNTSFSSTNTDDDLTDYVVLIDSDGNDLNLTANAEPPDFKRFVAQHYSRLWLAGEVNYAEGAVAITNASATVTGIDTNWTSSMVGWQFYPRGASNTKSYTVQAVNTSTQTITLTENYAGTTDPYAYYALRPGDDERRTIYFSKSAYPESFDLNLALTLPEEIGIGDITGLMPFASQLYILFESRIYRLTYQNDPAVDGFPFRAASRGCLPNCWALVDDAAYMMDRKGFWMFQGNNQDQVGAIVQPLFQVDSETRINFERVDHFHAVHDPLAETVKWFVCLAGHRYPRHAVCYHYRHQRWWTEEYSVPIVSSCLGELNGVPQVFLGSECRRILATGGASDGAKASDGTVNGTVTSSTLVTLSDSAASFSSNFVGAPVLIVSGTGKGQRRLISAVSSTQLTLVDPWVIQPDTTSVYQVGGFECVYRTGWYRLVQTGQNERRGVEIGYKPCDSGRLAFRKYEDRSTTPATIRYTRSNSDGNGISCADGETDHVVDLTRATGFVTKNEDGFLEFRTDGVRHVQFEFEFVPDEQRVELSEINLLGVRGR